jgi:hypothetical protein
MTVRRCPPFCQYALLIVSSFQTWPASQPFCMRTSPTSSFSIPGGRAHCPAFSPCLCRRPSVTRYTSQSATCPFAPWLCSLGSQMCIYGNGGQLHPVHPVGKALFVYLYLLSGLAEQPTQKAMLCRLQPRFNIIPFPACPRCQAPMDAVVHFFMACPRLAKACVFRAHRAALCLGGVSPPDHLLLYLAWPYFPPSVVENALILAVASFVELAWTPRLRPLTSP